ncbi:MAG: hypothetical protein ACPGVT_03920 [Maricaulaceae bacterium]
MWLFKKETANNSNALFSMENSKSSNAKIYEEIVQAPVSPAEAEYEDTSMSVEPTIARDPNVEEIQQAREYVDEISSELKTHSDQQNITARRMANLGRTISKLETNLRRSSGFETRSLELEHDLRIMKKQLEQKTNWAIEEESKRANLEKQVKLLQQNLEIAQSDIAVRHDREAHDRSTLQTQKYELEQLSVELSAREGEVSGLKISNQNLTEQINQQSAEILRTNNQALELQESLSEISTRADQKTRLSDEHLKSLKTLRLDHNELKATYFETSAALENMKYEVKAQKAQYEEALRRREDENLSMKNRIEQLDLQLRIKDNISGHLDQEILSLKSTFENERGRSEAAEGRLHEKTNELGRALELLSRDKADYENLNLKYTAAIEDLETLRKINQVQKQKLERYAALSGAQVEAEEYTAALTDHSGLDESAQQFMNSLRGTA